jgi:zinc transport system ATP-binding protein
MNKMALLDILNLKNKSFATLSGGQKQRVLLARALCSATKLLILDEPISNLDPKVTAEFYQLLNKINKETDLTIIMVSHDINATEKYAQKVLHLGDNENFFGTAEEYLNSGIGKNFMGGKTNDRPY